MNHNDDYGCQNTIMDTTNLHSNNLEINPLQPHKRIYAVRINAT